MSGLDPLEGSRTPGLGVLPARGGPEVTDAERRTTGDVSGHEDHSHRPVGGWYLWPIIFLCQPTLSTIFDMLMLMCPGGNQSFALPSWSLQVYHMVNVILPLYMVFF